MSYNGIGLQSTRGSGTSGYIQNNLGNLKNKEDLGLKSSHYKRRRLQKQVKEKEQERTFNETNKEYAKLEIKEHNRKRNIEVKCMELRDKLEDEDEDEDVIEAKVLELRKNLISKNTLKPETVFDSHEEENEIIKLSKDEQTPDDLNSDSLCYKPRYKSSTIKNLRSLERK